MWGQADEPGLLAGTLFLKLDELKGKELSSLRGQSHSKLAFIIVAPSNERDLAKARVRRSDCACREPLDITQPSLGNHKRVRFYVLSAHIL